MVAKSAPAPMPVAQNPTLTLDELAALERIGMTKCRDLARRNAFPFPVLRLGREYRVSVKAYERWRDGDAVDDDANKGKVA